MLHTYVMSLSFLSRDQFSTELPEDQFQYLPDAKHAEGGFYEPLDDYKGDPKPKHARKVLVFS